MSIILNQEGQTEEQQKSEIVTTDQAPTLSEFLMSIQKRLDNIDEVLAVTNSLQADFIEKINTLGTAFKPIKDEIQKMKRFIDQKYADEYSNFEK